ncbi:MMPL family transporter, partial [Candidatus Desantisbacteria bacterium]|nr:MMPL family transporter [Candidatus Desantisbacteria bacterium]
MQKISLVGFSVKHPRVVMWLVLAITMAFITQFPRIKIDTNPKNMLPETSDVRVWNDRVDNDFSLYEDMIVLGIVNKNGILNQKTLAKIIRITDEILRLKGVAARDVNGFSTITNVTAEAGILSVAPLMAEVPKDKTQMQALEKTLMENPLFINRLISKDKKTTAIYVPLEKGANGKEIADKIREIVKKEGGDQMSYYVAGDPVARDTFGAVMFKIMGIFSPIAGMIMFGVIYLMFRNLSLAISMMAVSMISIIWSMGLLIGLGFPVHIMSSMSPVFLMAIATDSIHIFNEFYFRYKEKRNKKQAILETMQAVGRPVQYTALATAAGFAVLVFMQIVPVKVFGGLLVFGTVVLRLLSFSFIPAILTFVREEKMDNAAQKEDIGLSRTSHILRILAGFGVYRPKTTVLVGLMFLGLAVMGTSKIIVNNNMVEWFKKDSEVRVADTVMNQALGGTSLGYIVGLSEEAEYIKTPEAMRYIEALQKHLEKLSVVGKTN